MRIVRSIVVGAVVALLASSSVSLGPALADGINWTSHDSANNKCCTAVTYGNGLFVAVSSADFTASGAGLVMTSPDGVTWTARNAAEGGAWRSVTYGNGLFVAVSGNVWDDFSGNFGSYQVMTSLDGITWTGRAAAAANSWTSVTYGNGLFVAVAQSGAGNRVMTSPDGTTWTSQTSAADNAWQSVTYGNGTFVAVAQSGAGNRVMTSPDGITWTSQTSAANNSWRSVTYGSGTFVAVAQSGTSRVMTSPDGVVWTGQTPLDSSTWTSVTYGAGLFVAVAAQEMGPISVWVMTSPDGITWTSRTAAKNLNWRSVTYGEGLFVAVASTSSDINGVGIDRVMTSGTFTTPTTTTTTTTAPPPPFIPPPPVSTVPPSSSTPTPTTDAPTPVTDPGGNLPRPDTGSGTLIEGGKPVEVVVTIENTSDLVMRGPDFELRISGECNVDCTISTTPQRREVVTLRERGLANVSGSGFGPGTLVDVWLFSEPRLLGQITVAADGTFEGQLSLLGIPAGEHTLQVNGVSQDAVERSANLGVIVEPVRNSLPVTGRGSSSEGWALMLLAVGGVLVAAGRRTRSS